MHDFDQNFVINLTPGTLNNKFKNPYYLRRFGKSTLDIIDHYLTNLKLLGSLAAVSVFGEHPSGSSFRSKEII